MSRIITYKGIKLQVVDVVSQRKGMVTGKYEDDLCLREFEVSYKLLTPLPGVSDDLLYSNTKILFMYKDERMNIITRLHQQRRACYEYLDKVLAGMSWTDQLTLGVGDFAPPLK
jgi:hypothetical protein